MSVMYFKRFRMEIDLLTTPLSEPDLPPGYNWESWHPGLLDRHAYTKWECFRNDLDATVFPCLGEYIGCLRLMQEIYNRDNFLASSTWLIHYGPNRNLPPRDCATIQGLLTSATQGAIQNVGVIPAHRGLGLGRALVLRCLHGFRETGVQRVSLEVTAQNTPAVELYRSLGFALCRTLYKSVGDEYSTYAPAPRHLAQV